MKNYAIIVAGGKGKRMQSSENKCFLELHEKPILQHTTDVFVKTNLFDKIIIILGNAQEIELAKSFLTNNSNFVFLETGGEARQDGVYTGIKYLKKLNVKPYDMVVIHNGANPLVTIDEICKSIDAAKEYGASVCAQRVKDTIKEVGEDFFIDKTLDRKLLWAMQTPQVIQYGLALEAFEGAYKDNFYGTDDVQLVERIGHKVKIVECSYNNFKITTKEDLKIAMAILKSP